MVALRYNTGMKKANLLWIDLEMTGLDPEKDRILELAAIATDWSLEMVETKAGEKAELTAVVKVPEELMKRRMVGEFWEKNAESRDGLIKQNATGKSAKEVEDELLKFIDKYFGSEVILAGNSIHQDRKFIDREWPRVAERLHYRMLDVSAWKVVFEGKWGKKFMKKENHRALDDILGSIDELKWYLSMVKEQK